MSAAAFLAVWRQRAALARFERRGAISHMPASERASEPRERSAPAKRRARARVGESEGRSPSDETRGHLTNAERASIASEPRDRSAPAKRRARARVGESEGRSPSVEIRR